MRQLDTDVTFCSPRGENIIGVYRHAEKTKNLTAVEFGALTSQISANNLDDCTQKNKGTRKYIE